MRRVVLGSSASRCGLDVSPHTVSVTHRQATVQGLRKTLSVFTAVSGSPSVRGADPRGIVEVMAAPAISSVPSRDTLGRAPSCFASGYDHLEKQQRCGRGLTSFAYCHPAQCFVATLLQFVATLGIGAIRSAPPGLPTVIVAFWPGSGTVAVSLKKSIIGRPVIALKTPATAPAAVQNGIPVDPAMAPPKSHPPSAPLQA